MKPLGAWREVGGDSYVGGAEEGGRGAVAAGRADSAAAVVACGLQLVGVAQGEGYSCRAIHLDRLGEEGAGAWGARVLVLGAWSDTMKRVASEQRMPAAGLEGEGVAGRWNEG